MSRSYKKPWIKDKRGMKPIHSRRFRRIIKNKILGFKNSGKDYDIGPVLPVKHSVSNMYDICDFRFYWSDIRATRK